MRPGGGEALGLGMAGEEGGISYSSNSLVEVDIQGKGAGTGGYLVGYYNYRSRT